MQVIILIQHLFILNNNNTNKQKKQNAKIIFNEARFNDIYLESLHLHRN